LPVLLFDIVFAAAAAVAVLVSASHPVGRLGRRGAGNPAW
jgi:hypothetical protein